MDNVIFVGGTGRCGTSILKEVIAQHQDAASLPFEIRFLLDPDGICDFYASMANGAWSPFAADKKLKRLHKLLLDLAYRSESGRYQDWELYRLIPDFMSYAYRLISEISTSGFVVDWVGGDGEEPLWYVPPRHKNELADILRKFVQSIARAIVESQDKKFLVLDETWAPLFARELLDILPGAKIIHIKRDPRDVVASMCNQPWCPRHYSHSAMWINDMLNRISEVEMQVPPSAFYTTTLEELIDDTAITLSAICSFVGIEMNEAMLDVDLSSGHVGRWRDDFNQDEQEQLNEILANNAKMW